MSTCACCDSSSTMTREHLLGDSRLNTPAEVAIQRPFATTGRGPERSAW